MGDPAEKRDLYREAGKKGGEISSLGYYEESNLLVRRGRLLQESWGKKRENIFNTRIRVILR